VAELVTVEVMPLSSCDQNQIAIAFVMVGIVMVRPAMVTPDPCCFTVVINHGLARTGTPVHREIHPVMTAAAPRVNVGAVSDAPAYFQKICNRKFGASALACVVSRVHPAGVEMAAAVCTETCAMRKSSCATPVGSAGVMSVAVASALVPTDPSAMATDYSSAVGG
jgi:hypothetical protein